MKKVFVLLAAQLLSLAACSKNAPGIYVADTLKALGISDAKSLFIGNSLNKQTTRSINNFRADEETKSLLKMTEDGVVTEVTATYTDANGNETSSTEVSTPRWVTSFNEDYIYVGFNDSIGPWREHIEETPYNYFNYLINIKTNRAYRLPYEYFLANMEGITSGSIPVEEAFQQTSDGTVYALTSTVFSSLPSGLIGIDLSNPDDLYSRKIGAAGDVRIESFVVDIDKNLIYYGSDSGGHSVARYISPTGAIKNFQETGELFRGLDGRIYSTTFEKRTDVPGIVFKCNLYRFSFENGQITKTLVSQNECSDSDGHIDSLNKRLYLKNYNKIIDTRIDGGSITILERYNTDMLIKYKEIDIPLTNIKAVTSSNKYIYFSGLLQNGDPAVGKLDISQDEYTFSLVVSGRYDVSSLSANSNEELSFKGLDMDENKYVIGTISSTGEISISSAVTDSQELHFVEINLN